MPPPRGSPHRGEVVTQVHGQISPVSTSLWYTGFQETFFWKTEEMQVPVQFSELDPGHMDSKKFLPVNIPGPHSRLSVLSGFYPITRRTSTTQ